MSQFEQHPQAATHAGAGGSQSGGPAPAPTPKSQPRHREGAPGFMGIGPFPADGGGPAEVGHAPSPGGYDAYNAVTAAPPDFARGMEQLHAGLLGGGNLINLLIQLGGTPAVSSLIQLLLSRLKGGGVPTAQAEHQAFAPAGVSAATWGTLVDLANRVIAIGKPFALQFVQKLVQELIVQQLQGGGSATVAVAEE